MEKINFGVWGFGRMGFEHSKFYAMEKEMFTLVATENEVRIRYINPDFVIPEVSVEKNTANYTNRLEKDIPRMEKIVKVESTGMWETIDRKLITHLYNAVREGIPSPIKNNDAFETIRIIQAVKKQNPQFGWIV